MGTGLRIFLYSIIVIFANGTLSIWVNYFSDYCQGIEPYSMTCINLLPIRVKLTLFGIVIAFFIMFIIEKAYPIKIDNTIDSINTSIISLGGSTLNKQSSQNSFHSVVYDQATKCIEQGDMQSANELTKLLKK